MKCLSLLLAQGLEMMIHHLISCVVHDGFLNLGGIRCNSADSLFIRVLFLLKSVKIADLLLDWMVECRTEPRCLNIFRLLLCGIIVFSN